MQPVNVCVPVLKRYDLLRDLLESLKPSTTYIDHVYIIDNGGDASRLAYALSNYYGKIYVETPMEPMGVAESWNWFIKNVPEHRVISNDDILFAPDSIQKMLDANVELAWACGFACFMIRDSCVEKIGLFDETISPGYGYYEDEDYLQRLDGRGTKPRVATAADVDAGIRHFHSATLKASTDAEVLAHHSKMLAARARYAKKWGVTF